MCTDSEGVKWFTTNIDRGAFMWMRHGEVGEDNSAPGELKD